MHRIIDQIDQLRKRIPEKTADARGHIDARALQFGKWNHFDAGKLPILRPPYRPYAEQCQNLRHIIAMGTHGTGAPDADGDTFRIAAGFAQMTRQYLVRQLGADPPR